MAMGYGGKETAMKSTKASFSKIESKAMAFTPGPMEMSTRDTIMPT